MERKISFAVLGSVLMFALPAYSAGTYYSGNYNSPQRNYSTSSYAARGQGTSYSQDTTYTRTRTVTPNSNVYVGQPYQNYSRTVGAQPGQAQTTNSRQVSSQRTEEGLQLNAGISHEFASWNFDMSSAGSKLHYDNIRWNVFDVNAAYKFGAGATPMQIDAGFKYGIQYGDSTMVDDDITNGGYIVTEWNDWTDTNGNGQIEQSELTYLGSQIGHSLSIGNSSNGDMLGFHAGFGLTDFIKLGGARVTPSIGYRYLKYKLETNKDYGLTVDTGYCWTVEGGDETQCDPILVFYNSTTNTQQVIWEHPQDDYFEIPTGANFVGTGGTYMFMLPGVSHSYETTWMGPYLALDLNYDINIYNSVNARFELGLPIYTSEGDQPYRSDWLHPKSVEDKGSFGDAWHIGIGANYMTALTESVYFSLGFTFDYYTLSGGEANTYLNSAYYLGIYNDLLDYYEDHGYDEDYMLAHDPTAQNIKNVQSECPGWVCKTDNEIESIYKSMGMRVGIRALF